MRTIIVRLFEPAPAAGSVEPHGFVEDVERGTRERFTRAAQLLEAIEKIAAQPRVRAEATSEESYRGDGRRNEP
ncbi:MAG: hypothetical protein ACRDT4_27010 [Micromonosporaceae bacterium]